MQRIQRPNMGIGREREEGEEGDEEAFLVSSRPPSSRRRRHPLRRLDNETEREGGREEMIEDLVHAQRP